MTEAAIDTGLTRDLYVSLGEPVGDGAWIVRVYYKPFVDWIWGGCLLMALGGLLAAHRPALPRRACARDRAPAPCATARAHEAALVPDPARASSSALAVVLRRRPASSTRARCRRR